MTQYAIAPSPLLGAEQPQGAAQMVVASAVAAALGAMFLLFAVVLSPFAFAAWLGFVMRDKSLATLQQAFGAGKDRAGINANHPPSNSLAA